jgi:hypothetical protein
MLRSHTETESLEIDILISVGEATKQVQQKAQP